MSLKIAQDVSGVSVSAEALGRAKPAAMRCNDQNLAASRTGKAAIFTASQISAAIGMKRQAVQWHLRNVPADSQTIVKNGAVAHAWYYGSLPESLRQVIDQAAQGRGYRNGETYLVNPPQKWQPKFPLATLHQDCIDYAAKLQRAQEYYFANRDNALLSQAELSQHALEDYARAFGHSVSERHCRDLLKRTMERDGGEGNWSNLALYLPDQIKQKGAAPAAVTSGTLSTLQETLASFSNPAEPTSAEQDLLWLRAFAIYKSTDARSAVKVKRSILEFLGTHAPSLAKSANALRVSFDRKFKAWTAGNGDANAIADGREKKRGQAVAAPYDPEQIRLVKFAAATRHEGKTAPALRDLAERGLITDPRIKQFLDTRTSKSYLPKSFQDQFKDLPAYRLAHLGPRALGKMVPPRELTYEGIHSMTCLVGDDLTSPVYVYVPDGEGWFKMTRCQLLCVADFRSLFITSFALNPSGQYNSLDVRTVYTTAFAEHGMPRFILREGGLWRNSKNANSLAAIGTSRSAEAPFSDAEVECGLERAGVRVRSSIEDLCRDVGDLGIQFREAFRARTKPIERVFDLLQSLMAGEPGFCGRDEKVDCPEAVRKNLEMVRTRKAHPRELGFYSFEQWTKRLEEIIAKYNQSPQEGRRLKNPITGQPMSPQEAFSVFWNQNDPPSRFDASCAMFLSHMKIEVEVKKPDLRRRQFPCGYIVVRGNTYCSEETGSRIGQKLLAHFNPHLPESCTFTDMKLRNRFTVRRLESTNALFIDDQTKLSSQQAQSAIAPVRTEFRAMQAQFSSLFGSPFRTNMVDPRTAALNQHVQDEATASVKRQRADQSRRDTIRRKARNLEVPSAMLTGDEETRRALDDMEAARRAHAQTNPKAES